MKRMTEKQIAATFRKAPRYSYFTVTYGKPYQQFGRPLVLLPTVTRTMKREAAKEFCSREVVFKIESTVIKPVRCNASVELVRSMGRLD
jgi:hypothetical protein